jgi:basic amino acid/polyamine antiporter, APA family
MQTLKPRDILALGIGTIIGVGWIVAVSGWIVRSGPAGAAIAFMLGALIVSLVSRCYGEAAERFPERGGELRVALAVFGPTAAFATGCALLAAYLTAIVFEVAALGWILGEVGAGVGIGPRIVIGVVVLLQALAVAGNTWVNARGAAASSGAQNALTLVKIVGIGLIVAAGILSGHTAHLAPPFDALPGESPVSAMAAITISTPFWFAGFNVIAQATPDRAATTTLRQVANTITGSVLICGLLYAAIIFAVGALVPRARLQSLPFPAADAVAIATGQDALKWVVLLISGVGILAAWNGMTFAVVRIYQGLAASDLPPGMHRRTDAPTLSRRGLAATIVAALAGIIVGRPAMEPAIAASAICMSAVFAVVCFAILRLRLQSQPARRWSSLLVPAGGVLLSLALVIMAAILPAVQAHGVPVEWQLLGPAALVAAIIWRLAIVRQRSASSRCDA